MSARPGGLAHFIVVALALGIVAALAPARGFQTDRDIYQSIGDHYVLPDCSSIHCFRPLVPWILETLPGPSLFKWKLYAVLCNAGAAVAVAWLSLTLGLSARAAWLASGMAAFGFGSFFTLFDPYGSDPLMYVLGPLGMKLLVEERIALAGTLGAIGVLAKEFAAAPLWIFTVASALARKWRLAARTLVAANLALLVWLALQLWLILAYNYTYAGSPSADPLSGGYLVPWLESIGPAQAIAVLAANYGALLLLVPFGLMDKARAPRELRLLALAAIPIAVIFGYIQQPDRALWNFHFLIIPLAAVMIERLPDALAWLFVASQAMASLRFGGHQALLVSAYLGVMLSLGLALAAIVTARRGAHQVTFPMRRRAEL